MSFESLQVYDLNCLRDHESYLAQYNIQILKNNKQQLSFKEYVENLQDQEQKDDLTYMDEALQEIGYKSVKFAGKGSFGTTIIAEDQNQNRFAFKLIFIRTRHGQISQDIKDKALKEANVMSKMDHPNVVKFYKYYQTQNYFIIQMEECKGDLLQLMKSYELLSIESFIKYGQEISEGIQYLHDQGLVIRDLKQDNILIDQVNVAKIADFGLAAHVEVGTSKVKYSIQGAQLFRAPELQDELCQDFIQQLKKEDPSLVLQSKKSDCFSLGLIFYSCLGTQLSKFINIIQQGPASIDIPVMIEGQPELKCIDKMLQLLCERHPNKRMKISDVILQFQLLERQYLPNLNRYPVPIKIQRISNQKILILTESKSCNNKLQDNYDFQEEKEEQKNQEIFQKVSLQEQIKDAYIIDENTRMSLQNQIQQYQEKQKKLSKENQLNQTLKIQCVMIIQDIQMLKKKIKKSKQQLNNFQLIFDVVQSQFVKSFNSIANFKQNLLKVTLIDFFNFDEIYNNQEEIFEDQEQMIQYSNCSSEYSHQFQKISQQLKYNDKNHYYSLNSYFEILKIYENLTSLDMKLKLLQNQQYNLTYFWNQLRIENREIIENF